MLCWGSSEVRGWGKGAPLPPLMYLSLISSNQSSKVHELPSKTFLFHDIWAWQCHQSTNYRQLPASDEDVDYLCFCSDCFECAQQGWHLPVPASFLFLWSPECLVIEACFSFVCTCSGLSSSIMAVWTRWSHQIGLGWQDDSVQAFICMWLHLRC